MKTDYQDYASAVVRAVLEYIGEPSVSGNTYTVQAGDSLWSITKKLGVTVDELKQANNLTSNLLRVGQILKVPTTETEEEGTVYIVKSGDNLYSIARQYGLTPAEIMEYNNLTSNLLSIGQRLRIPTSTEVPDTSDSTVYIVKSGDNLYSIARQYGITVSQLMEYNNLSSNLLSIGQILQIPANGTTGTTGETIYTVKSGDNLYSIARQYGLTPAEIMEYNNLTNNLLSIGQQLRIPVSSSGITYVVKSGDNLYSIANRYNTTVDAIKNKNNLTSNNLQIGQVLTI